MEIINHKNSWKNPAVILSLIAMVLLTGIIIISLLRDRFVNNQQWQASFTGQGKVNYQPDIANINMGVQVDKKTKPEDALNELNKKINNIIKAIKDQGVPADNIKTQNYTLALVYDYVNNVSKLAGYSANQIITVKVENINQNQNIINKIVSVASQASVNQINGIVFEASNIEDLKQEARIEAIADAKSKADKLSREMGISLGKVVGWWENYQPVKDIYGSYGGGLGMGGGGEAGASPVIPSGSQEIVVEVNISYKIK